MSPENQIQSYSHHERMQAAWDSGRFRAEYIFDTYNVFLRRLRIKPFDRRVRILDIGCGIGLRVAALRILGINAFGIDREKELIYNMTVPQAKDFCFVADLNDELARVLTDFSPGFVISDDVFEHLSLDTIKYVLTTTRNMGVSKMLHSLTPTEHTSDINNDPSHVTKLCANDWVPVFTASGWDVDPRHTAGNRQGVFLLNPSNQPF